MSRKLIHDDEAIVQYFEEYNKDPEAFIKNMRAKIEKRNNPEFSKDKNSFMNNIYFKLSEDWGPSIPDSHCITLLNN